VENGRLVCRIRVLEQALEEVGNSYLNSYREAQQRLPFLPPFLVIASQVTGTT
jgi:hypothetical protein